MCVFLILVIILILNTYHSGRKLCGLLTQGTAPSSLCPGLGAGWPFRLLELRCVQRLAYYRGCEAYKNAGNLKEVALKITDTLPLK